MQFQFGGLENGSKHHTHRDCSKLHTHRDCSKLHTHRDCSKLHIGRYTCTRLVFLCDGYGGSLSRIQPRCSHRISLLLPSTWSRTIHAIMDTATLRERIRTALGTSPASKWMSRIALRRMLVQGVGYNEPASQRQLQALSRTLQQMEEEEEVLRRQASYRLHKRGKMTKKTKPAGSKSQSVNGKKLPQVHHPFCVKSLIVDTVLKKSEGTTRTVGLQSVISSACATENYPKRSVVNRAIHRLCDLGLLTKPTPYRVGLSTHFHALLQVCVSRIEPKAYLSTCNARQIIQHAQKYTVKSVKKMSRKACVNLICAREKGTVYLDIQYNVPYFLIKDLEKVKRKAYKGVRASRGWKKRMEDEAAANEKEKDGAEQTVTC